jgi:hypothetical protein
MVKNCRMNQLRKGYESGGKLPAVNLPNLQIIFRFSEKLSVRPAILFKMKNQPVNLHRALSVQTKPSSQKLEKRITIIHKTFWFDAGSVFDQLHDAITVGTITHRKVQIIPIEVRV